MNLDKSRVIAILGDIDTCKTNLAIHLLREYEGNRQIYLLGYPRKIDDFIPLNSFQDLFKLQDAIIFIDEIQRFIRTYEHHKNVALQELISFFAHNNNTLIFTTQLSQFITKGTEAFVDTWLITRLNDVATLKNGSKPKRIIQTTVSPKATSWSLALENGEYLEYSELNGIGENGIKNFPDQGIGKDWRVKTPNKIANEIEFISQLINKKEEILKNGK